MSANPACKLRIIRRSEYIDMLRSYRIIVNGTEVGTIARNAALDLEVPSGPLKIEARLDWWLVEGWPDYIGESRSLGVKKRSRTRPTWFSTCPFSQPDAGVQATGSTR